MYLEGKEWKNYHTKYTDNNCGQNTKLNTISVLDLLYYANTAWYECKINGLNPNKVPVFITLEEDNSLYSKIGLSIHNDKDLGTYVTLDSSDNYKLQYISSGSKSTEKKNIR